MSLFASSLSYQRADLPLRETLAFSQERQRELLRWLRRQPGVEGAVLLSTCNRTEVYLSGDCETPWRLLCRGAGVEHAGMEEAFVTYTGEDAARHLMEVACGLQSQLRGENQILSQVRMAMDLSQEENGTDSQLSALFRMAVTVGKRVRAEVQIAHAAPSAGQQVQDTLEKALGSLGDKWVLVIGNGQMGRMTAGMLQQAGARVTVTLRSYRHRETIVPAGCTTIPYEERAALFQQVDAIVSATTSPHYTVLRSHLEGRTRPLEIIDLAVPRDVEPDCAQLPQVHCRNIDTMASIYPQAQEERARIHALIQEQMEEYRRWKRAQTLPETPFRFPLFINLAGKKVVLVGGGSIASRRIGTLRLFGCELVVIAPELHAQQGSFTWLQREYQSGDLAGAAMAIAATDSRELNHQIGLDAKALGIPVSVADREEECTFYFPAICAGERVIAGVVSHGKDHHATARAAKEIRKVLEELP